MRFPYRFLRLPQPDPATGLGQVARPIIPIRLSAPSAEQPDLALFGLVDSGSDWCLFREETGRELGIDVSSGEARGFVGVEELPVTAYFHVTLQVGGMRAIIRAGFVRGLRFSYGVLGQAGFFDQFIVTMSAARPRPYVEVLRVH